MELYQLVVENYKRDKWKARPFDGMLEIKIQSAISSYPFWKLCVLEISEGGTFVDAAFSFLTPEEFRDCRLYFPKAAAETWSTVLLSVVDYASLQFPELLLPYHERLVKTSAGLSYADRWAWRGAGALKLIFLAN